MCFLPWTLLLSQQQKDNDANSKLEMFNFSIVPRLSQPRPLPSFCCGGVVREALLSVRVRTGRCPLGTERKNCVQGLWTLSRAKGSRTLVARLNGCYEGLSKNYHHVVARVFSTRAVTPPQVGVDPRRRRRGGALLRVLKRQLSNGWLDFTFAV